MFYNKILAIAAVDPAGVLGKSGKLPWHCPEDLSHFTQTIADHPIIMGRRTYETLPLRHLKDRTSLIFTRQNCPPTPNQHFLSSLDQFFALSHRFSDLYVIGGGQIYTLFLRHNLLDECLLTRFKTPSSGDTFFPLSLLDSWPSLLLQETPLFTLHRYPNPQRRTP